MKASGSALMGIGRGQGEGRAVKAAEIAINSQLLETSINGASGVIVNVTGGPDMTLHEITDAANIINNAVLEDATVIVGTTVNENIQGEIQVTVIATGFELKDQITETKIDTKRPEDFFNDMAYGFSRNTNSTSPSFAPIGVGAATMSSTQTRRSQEGSGMYNIEIPDFLKK